MKNKNGRLIKDSQYLTLQIAKKKFLSSAVECLVVLFEKDRR